MSTIPITQSQLRPPPIKEQFVRRSKLNKKLIHIPKYPLTLLYAGAGYGKSTALSLFAHDLNTDICWYTLSQNDDDILPFLTKLIQSIKQNHSFFGNKIQEELEELDNYITIEKVYSLASSFINEIMSLEESVILILDDFHHVKHSTEIEKWMLFVLQHIPSNLHMVVSSRNRPEWDVMSKYKIKGDLLEITQRDLTLSPAEMNFILEDMHQLNMSDEDVAKIHTLTEGWTIAFNMLVQQLHTETSVETIFLNRQKSLEDLFDYLAHEVLSKQSLIIQQFLMQSSIMEVLSPEVCDHVLQINGSEEILAGLVKQNLFIEEGEGNYYRYHALFKAFLENLLLLKHENEYNTLHMVCVKFFSVPL
ncbi:hypothetical protein ACFQ3N_10910 [Virgibacillus byunsanensis]|uniref:MalT-like winged helix domain-containing protein n=1 Tax=Virgibacillus byunsanensis TaxID=570945 RepID=A0ABW3LKG2_9BACI